MLDQKISDNPRALSARAPRMPEAAVRYLSKKQIKDAADIMGVLCNFSTREGGFVTAEGAKLDFTDDRFGLGVVYRTTVCPCQTGPGYVVTYHKFVNAGILLEYTRVVQGLQRALFYADDKLAAAKFGKAE